MTDKTELARLKRVWQGQEIDQKIWENGIIPNFISQNGDDKTCSFTCYELSKIMDSISYQTLYKHLIYYEKKYLLESEIITNKNNRKERRFTVIKRGVQSIIKGNNYWLKYYDYESQKENKVKAQKEYEDLHYIKTPDRLYRLYREKKLSGNDFIQRLKDYIDTGDLRHYHFYYRLCSKCIKYIVEYSPKDKELFKYLEYITVSNSEWWLREEALTYTLEYFPQYSDDLQKHVLLHDKDIRFFEISKNDIKYFFNDNLYKMVRNIGKTLKEYFGYSYKKSYNRGLRGIVYARNMGYNNYINWILVTNQQSDIFKNIPYKKVIPSQERKNFKRETRLERVWFRIREYIVPIKHLYFAIKIVKEYGKFKDSDVKIAIPSIEAPIKIFSENSKIRVYLNPKRLHAIKEVDKDGRVLIKPPCNTLLKK